MGREATRVSTSPPARNISGNRRFRRRFSPYYDRPTSRRPAGNNSSSSEEEEDLKGLSYFEYRRIKRQRLRKKLRGKEGKKVESASGDTNFQALKTYGRDRDEEIQLILAVLDDSQINDCFKEAGISASMVRSEVEKLRGKEGKKVESASGDTNFQALRTYGRDLVDDEDEDMD